MEISLENLYVDIELSARDHRLLLEHCLKYVKNLLFSQPIQKISKKREKRQEKQLFPFCAFRAKLTVYCLRCSLSVCINYKYTYHTM